MNILVTYGSKYGHTERYARWIAQDLDCACKPAGKVGREELARCDVLVHGGGLYAGGLRGISVLTKNDELLREKNLVLFSCGLADPEDPGNVAHIEAGLARVLTPQMQTSIRQFHFRGGIDYARLSPVHRGMMAMLCRAMGKKGYEHLKSEDRLMLDTYGKQIDFSDKGAIAPLVAYVKGLG